MKSDVKCRTEEDKNGKDRERCRERERVRKRETEMERESFKASEEMTYERVWPFYVSVSTCACLNVFKSVCV